MDKNASIVVTGAAGFIGSCLAGFLNEKGYANLILVDDFTRLDKTSNLEGKLYTAKVEREDFFTWLHANKPAIGFVFHIGARTDTTEFDYAVHRHLNVEYSQKIWHYCTVHHIPLVYASSAATYGAGELGYDDNHEVVPRLKPLNAYGISKNEFDKWALHQTMHPPFWAGLKFFNVYGPNEYHKARMASVIFHAFRQIKGNGTVKLFRSHRPEYKDGWQLRDFVYVKDVIDGTIRALDAKGARAIHERRGGMVNLSYGNGRTVRVPKGLSVLEASLRNNVPHASVCGGRARCSTCRIRIIGDCGELPTVTVGVLTTFTFCVWTVARTWLPRPL